MIQNKRLTAQRMDHLAPHFFATLGAKIAAMQAAGRDVIRLDEGSPDMPPAPFIIEALGKSAALASHHSYQSHKGTRALRAAWAEMYNRVYQVSLDPETEILPLLGSKEGIFHLMLALIGPGDGVLVPDPGYITYSRGALAAGGEVHFLPLTPEHGYLPDLNAVPSSIINRAKILWLNYPNNPTSATATVEFFAEAVEFSRRYGLLVCHDAAYSQLNYDGYRAPSILEIPGARDVAIEFNTLSKSHNMAGWRIGAALGNPQVLRTLHTLKTNLDSGHFLPVMDAAVAAMTGDQSWLLERNKVYSERRDIVFRALSEAGFSVAKPQASLYFWSGVPAGLGSIEFVTRVLEDKGVSLTPGIVFGSRGEGHFRLSITAPTQQIVEAMGRLKTWMGA